jgi:hypothetical protein
MAEFRFPSMEASQNKIEGTIQFLVGSLVIHSDVSINRSEFDFDYFHVKKFDFDFLEFCNATWLFSRFH